MQIFGRKAHWLTILSAFLLIESGWAQQASNSTAAVQQVRGTLEEDLTSLSLASSELKPEEPVLGEKHEFPLFTRELIQVKWRRGDPIDLYIIRPKNVVKPPVILYLYSYPSETDRFRDDDYCVRLTRDGFAAVGFVSALTGHRYKNRSMKEWFVSEMEESLVTSVHDVQMILNFLSTRDDLDMSKVGMFGAGSGGTIAILSAAIDSRVQAIDLLDPWGDWPEWTAKSSIIPENERSNLTKADFLATIAWLDPVQWLPQLHLQHLRIEHVLDDEVTPVVAKDKMESVAPKIATLVRYENTGQFFHAVSGGRIFQWLKDTLQPPAQPQNLARQKSQDGTRRIEPGHDD
ncbi:MAG TPA: alpha/beta hydrolase [Terriglobales bacterium]|nr:alpha/beta hydrolase [Terriglobales bacterium]